ncbi:MAG: photosynthetic reaction center subunit M, partial [Janthinobacterium lividum]
MARFHTLYTAIQVTGPEEEEIPIEGSTFGGRLGKPITSRLLGIIGETQVFPVYLGITGVLSLICGFIAIEIIGLNFLAAVDWNVVRFIKMLPFLAIQPPPAKYG